MIAALFVATDGCYFGLPDVDPWDVKRDARLYAGPWPVVAHPPCERWGHYWHGGPSARVRKIKGDDGGCFSRALASVRAYGGVLEHPADSAAWLAFGLTAPPRTGGWIMADFDGGWTCCVEQGHYGHRARKATWLYTHGVELRTLKWGPSAARVRMDAGFHSAEERRKFMRPAGGNLTCEFRKKRREWMAQYAEQSGKVLLCPEMMGKRERMATPLAFRDLLLLIARSAQKSEVA